MLRRWIIAAGTIVVVVVAVHLVNRSADDWQPGEARAQARGAER